MSELARLRKLIGESMEIFDGLLKDSERRTDPAVLKTYYILMLETSTEIRYLTGQLVNELTSLIDSLPKGVVEDDD